MNIDDLIKKRKNGWKKHRDLNLDKEFIEAIADELLVNDSFRKETIRECKRDNRKFIEAFMIVHTKEDGTTPFFLTKEQHELCDTIVSLEDQYNKNLIPSKKIFILKARQLGFTTVITAIQNTRMILEKNFSGFTMAHDDDATSSIFNDKARNVLEELPRILQPTFERSNKKELVTKNSRKNKWRASTAGSKDPGRSKTLNFIHFSERGFYKEVSKIDASIISAATKDALEIIETTANGYNHLKELYDETIAGNNDYIFLFFPWYTNDYYETRFENREIGKGFKKSVIKAERFKGVDSSFMKFLRSVSTDIPEICNSPNKWNKLYWYFKMRQRLKNKLFQEYPTTPNQSFLMSGNPYFDTELIDIQLNSIKDPIRTIRGGEIEIYEVPVSGVKYCIGSDVAEGLDGGDSSSFSIVRIDTMKEVVSAEYKAKPDEHGRILNEWGIKYNHALLGVERNNHGHSTINTLENECRYRYLYMERTLDKKNNKITNRVGWLTTEKSKFIMLDDLDTAHRNGQIEISSMKTLKQMREVQNENGKVNVNGKDRVVGIAIAYQMKKNQMVNRIDLSAPIIGS